MGRKLNLLNNLNELAIKYNTLIINELNEPENTEFFPILKNTNPNTCLNYWKCDEIKNKIDWVTAKLDALENYLKVKRYYETEEGIKIKNELENSIEQSNNRRREVFKEYEAKFKKLIIDELDEDWMINLSSNRIIVGLKDKETGEPFEFGHTFEIFYDNWQIKDLILNYGTMGGFHPINDNYRSKYLLGLGKISSDTDLMRSILNIFIMFNEEIMKIDETCNEIRKKLKNPF